jgi:hypothetical protein
MPARKQIIKGFYAAVYSTVYKLIKVLRSCLFGSVKGFSARGIEWLYMLGVFIWFYVDY